MMLRPALSRVIVCWSAALVIAVATVALPSFVQAGSKPVTLSPKLDEAAPVAELFDALEKQQIDARLVHRDEKSGNLLIDNLTGATLSIKLPDAFVGIHVLNQQGFNFGQLGQNGQNGQGNQSGASQRGGQATGGGAASGNNGQSGQNNGFFGNNVFSIPPDRIIRIPVKSVCLEHGKLEPSPRMEYRVAPVESVTRDPVLKAVLAEIARGEIRQPVGQAIAWHLANGKTWQQLAAMRTEQLAGLPGIPLFLQRDLIEAQAVLKAITERVARPQSVAANDSVR